MVRSVLHLIGSPTDDFSERLSRLYAADCLAATADPSRWTTTIAHVGPDRQWRFPANLSRQALADAPPMPLADALSHLTTLSIDVAVPQMFCLSGMTTYRALLDLLRLPYAGNTATTMALTADKAKARAVVAAAGVDVPDGCVVRAGSPPPLPLPVVVKPVDSDNSLAVSLVRDPARYDAAVRSAAAASSTGTALVERYVELGREVRCGVLEQDGRLVCLPLEEYAVGPDHPVRTYDDKLAATPDGELRLVAKTAGKAWSVPVEDPVTESVWAAARTCHTALGCRQYSLFDYRIDPAGRPFFLEAGLYCSFAATSVLAVMARAAGTDLPELFKLVLDQALPAGPAAARLLARTAPSHHERPA